MAFTLVYDPVYVARMFQYLREAGQNRGRRVEGILCWGGGTPGDSWCDYFAIGFILDICFQGKSPFPRTIDIDGSTVEALKYARSQGWVVPYEVSGPGDLVFSVHPDGTPHHVALETQHSPLKTIAGNTSEDGVSSNGDRVAEHEVSPDGKVFVRYPRV
jgi:hypothetical protein